MIYKNIKEGIFKERPNRFIAIVEIDGKLESCHVKNTGRCKELLVPECKVFVDECPSPTRKTKFDLVAVLKGQRLINIDSQAPNKVFYEFLKENKFIPQTTLIKPEFKYGNSRLDFFCESNKQKSLIEVKGVTLEENDAVYFPDAPTQRGIKHLNELIGAVSAGFSCYAVFIIQMEGVTFFSPNNKTHKAFGDAMIKAKEKGVKLLAFDCKVAPESMFIKDKVPIIL